jgi:hypothetical protein
MDKIWGFEGQKRLLPHHERRIRWSLHHPHPSACRARRGIRNGTPRVRRNLEKTVKTPNFGQFW